VNADADEVLGQAQKSDRGPGKVDQAAEWLVKFLEKYAYPSEEGFKAAGKAGFSKDNMYDAKRKLKPRVQASNKGGCGGEWNWGLGDPDQWTIGPDQPEAEWAVFPADPDAQDEDTGDPGGGGDAGRDVFDLTAGGG